MSAVTQLIRMQWPVGSLSYRVIEANSNNMRVGLLPCLKSTSFLAPELCSVSLRDSIRSRKRPLQCKTLTETIVKLSVVGQAIGQRFSKWYLRDCKKAAAVCAGGSSDGLGQSSAWSEERLAQFKVLAQLKADEVVESIQIVSKADLDTALVKAQKAGRVTEEEVSMVLEASLIARGEDLDIVHIVADVCPDAAYAGPDIEAFAIEKHNVDLVLRRADILRRVVDTLVLPVLIGGTIAPSLAKDVEVKGIHLIRRAQESLKAVF